MRLCSSQIRIGKRQFSHWKNIPLAPPDKILGLNEAFKADLSASKVNLGVGAYRDDNGKPVVLNSVKKAEQRIMEKGLDHEYASIGGVKSFIDQSLVFAYGANSKPLLENRIAAVQSLSGTGGCRLATEFLSRFLKGKKIYISNPTWGNHLNIARDSGLSFNRYRYFDPSTCGIDFNGLLDDIHAADDESIFLFHACAHNPTGTDPSPVQWMSISDALKAKNHVVLMDCAYQGFASGDSEKDAFAIRMFVEQGHQILLTQSYAKNIGLYGERVGTLSIVASDEQEKNRLESQLKTIIRPMYSNPPLFGARVVNEILSDPILREEWRVECQAMAHRIRDMRTRLRDELEALGSKRNWSHITDQIGMFAFTGLNPEQVRRLTSDFHIFLTEDGRISVAGLNSKNVAYVASAMHTVTL